MQMKLPVISISNCAILLALFGILGMSLCAIDASAQSPIRNLVVEQPSSAKPYLIGDKFTRIVTLQLNPPYELQRESLPKAGRLIPWLHLEPPAIDSKISSKGNEYRIVLRYQITNIDTDHLDVGVAGHKIKIQQADEELNILIPATRINAEMLTKSDTFDIRPDARPQTFRFDSRNLNVAAGVLLTSILALLLLWLAQRYYRERHPFADTYRQICKVPVGEWGEQDFRRALQGTHRAFNRTAGKTLFKHDLAQFVAERPSFGVMRQQIMNYFEFSRHYFFLDGKSDVGLTPDQLLQFVQQCSEIEQQ
ncbi:MAG: hypothetical protein AAF387_07535 [Pseudomonadota bacterium]